MLASIVAEKKRLQNWHVYYHNKYERDPSKRPTTRVAFFSGKVNFIVYFTI